MWPSYVYHLYAKYSIGSVNIVTQYGQNNYMHGAQSNNTPNIARSRIEVFQFFEMTSEASSTGFAVELAQK